MTKRWMLKQVSRARTVVTGAMLLGLALALAASRPPVAHANAIVVNTLSWEQNSGDGTCSLREALLAANNNAAMNECPAGSSTSEDTITFSVSGTITESFSPSVTDPAGLVIDGAGQNVTITGGSFIAFIVSASSKLSLLDLTIANDSVGGWGAGVSNSGTLVVGHTAFVNNAATAGAGGAAIFSETGSNLTVYNSTFTGNTAVQGCAIYVASGATANITNSTIAGNNCTSTPGGALKNQGTVTVRNTIVANNGVGNNCVGTITNGGNNIDSGTSCGFGSTSGSLSSTNPQVSALGNYGGPTQTMAPIASSPAINAGNATVCAATPGSPNYGAGGNDQRGQPRRSGYCDVGAFEAQPASVAAVSGSTPQSTHVSTPFGMPLTVKLQDAYGNALGGLAVTFTTPSTGASAILSGASAVSDSSGNAAVTAAANSIGGGPYNVSATSGTLPVVNFSLTNIQTIWNLFLPFLRR